MPILTPLKNKVNNYKLYGFDIETYGSSNKFLMGSIVNDKEKYIFWNHKDLKNFILTSSKLRNSIIFATNLGFDFLGTFGTSFKDLSNFNICIRGSDFIIVSFYNGKHKITFMDTMNHIKCGVKALGNIIGIPKLKTPKNIGKYCKRYSNDGRYMEKYNIRDSYVTFKFAKFLQQGYNKIGAELKSTIASTSMNLFRRKYLRHQIIQPEKRLLEEQFNAYYGGRTEAFYRGKLPPNKYKYYDINSLYPYVMSKFQYPFPNTIKEYNHTLYGEDYKYINKYEGISYCKIQSPKYLNIPLLPFRCSERNKLLFPLGDFQAYYPHIELRKAASLGYQIIPIRTIYFTQVFNPFKDFVEDLYKQRLKYKAKDDKMQIVSKILLNSLYGKWSQKLYQSKILFSDNLKQYKEALDCIRENGDRIDKGLPIRYDIDFPYNETYEEDGITFCNPKIYYVNDLETKKYPKFINPILSIYITGYARLELYKLFEKAQKYNSDVLYCDTDSIITNYDFQESTKLGALKKEADISRGLIIKPKFYYLEDKDRKTEKIKAKGLYNLRTYMDFKKVLETKRYKYMKFTKFKESLRRNLDFNTKIDVEKVIGLEDNKREWKNKKFNIKRFEKSKPIVLS